MKAKLLAVCLLLLVVAAPACRRNNNQSGSSRGTVSVATRPEDVRPAAGSLRSLRLTNGTGTVQILPADGDEVAIQVMKQAQGLDAAANEACLDKIRIAAVEEDGCLVVGARLADSPDQDFWEWFSAQSDRATEVAIHYTVQVPAAVKTFTVNNRTGGIVVEDVTGSFLIQGGTINLTIQRVRLTGRSLVIVHTGDIVLDIDPADASEIMVNNGSGDIDIAFPAAAPVDLRASIAAGTITGDVKTPVQGSGAVEQVYGGGGTKLTVSGTTGNIVIRNE